MAVLNFLKYLFVGLLIGTLIFAISVSFKELWLKERIYREIGESVNQERTSHRVLEEIKDLDSKDLIARWLLRDVE